MFSYFLLSSSMVKVPLDGWKILFCTLYLFSVSTLHDDSGGGSSLASKLRTLSSESFVQLLGAIFKIVLVMFTCLYFCSFEIDI